MPSESSAKPANATINLHDNDIVAHWARTFGVTFAELRVAVAHAGNDAQQVQAFLLSLRETGSET